MLNSHQPDYWTHGVAFYLDGVSFVYKGNPLSDAIKPNNRIWRKKGEGLILTTKGSKDLAGGKRLHLRVVISYGKGVIFAEPYEKMTAEFIRRHFPNLFEIAGKGDNDRKVFVMDNDPSQTSAKAMGMLDSMGFALQKIPPRSPDLNPIESVFNLARKRLREQTIKKMQLIKRGRSSSRQCSIAYRPYQKRSLIKQFLQWQNGCMKMCNITADAQNIELYLI